VQAFRTLHAKKFNNPSIKIKKGRQADEIHLFRELTTHPSIKILKKVGKLILFSYSIKLRNSAFPNTLLSLALE
jgi:hypothetical protein